MRTLEKILWTTGCVLGVWLTLYTLTLPEDHARRLWGGHDPVWCVPVGIALLIGCLIWIWLQTRREEQ